MSATIPPLLMLAEGRRPRLRKAPQSRPKEIVLHMAVAKMLREHCRPDWLWTHIASGELRDVRTAGKLKQMGSKPGWPDLVLVPPTGQLHCLELKRRGKTLSAEQEQFQLHCIRHNIPHSVAFNFDEALAVLDAWGCLRITLPKNGGAE
jgi:VRR-NUC domain